MKKLILTLVLSFLSANTVLAQTPTATVRQIDAFAKSVDAKTKKPKGAKLIFADVSGYESNEPANWQRFESEKALGRQRDKSEAYSIAYVWLDGGKVVSTNFTLSSPSGDWVKYIYSYYRPNGSLARVERDLRTFNGDFRVIRRRYFNSAGKEISRSVKFLDLQTRQPKKAPDGVMGDDPEAADFFMTTSKLPFDSLLTKK